MQNRCKLFWQIELEQLLYSAMQYSFGPENFFNMQSVLSSKPSH